jgi:hypothetical protein
MSLKTFHLVFITAASALAAGCGIWSLRSYFSPEGRGLDLAVGVGAILAAIGLVIYERYFLKKTKNVSFL